MNRQRELLMVFVRNAQIGQVKTRLAARVGPEAALEIYISLLNHTAAVASKLRCAKAVFYSEYTDEFDEFSDLEFYKFLQFGDDLGEKMKNAFVRMFGKGYDRIIIIGSDCLELDDQILRDAFYLLDKHDVVIGPARDGGYYLLGMKQLHHEFFKHKSWSTSNVFLDTLLDVKAKNLTYALLPELNDIDEFEDLPEHIRSQFSL